MTRTQTIAAIKSLGRHMVVKVFDGEYRVTFNVSAIMLNNPQASYTQCRDKAEAIAYYTSDAEDAVSTAKSMHEQYVNNPACVRI